MPTTEDLNKAREQASQTFGEAVEQARTPLMAALGAGDLAANALVATLSKIREQAEGARAGLNDLSNDPDELRKRVDDYVRSATQLYGYLADRGEETFDRLRAQAPTTEDTRQADKSRDSAEKPEEDSGLDDDVLGSTPASSSAGKSTRSSKSSTTSTKSSTKTTSKQSKPRSS